MFANLLGKNNQESEMLKWKVWEIEQKIIQDKIGKNEFPAKILNTSENPTSVWHAIGTAKDNLLYKKEGEQSSKSYIRFWIEAFKKAAGENFNIENTENFRKIFLDGLSFDEIVKLSLILNERKENLNEEISEEQMQSLIYSLGFFGKKTSCERCFKKPLCVAEDCTNRAEHGAHVYDGTQLTNQNWNICWIIPTCPQHNMSSTSNKNNYPLPWEAQNVKDFDDGKAPNNIRLNNEGMREGMKIKKNTFAVLHVITKKDALEEALNKIIGKKKIYWENYLKKFQPKAHNIWGEKALKRIVELEATVKKNKKQNNEMKDLKKNLIENESLGYPGAEELKGQLKALVEEEITKIVTEFKVNKF